MSAAILGRVDDPETSWPMGPDEEEALVALEELRGRSRELAVVFSTEAIQPAEFKRAQATLRAQEVRARRRVEVAGASLFSAGTLRNSWPTLALAERRWVVRRLIETVVVHPQSRGERLEIRWKT